jgi:hypothetical protein
MYLSEIRSFRHLSIALLTIIACVPMLSCKTSVDFPAEYRGEQIHFGQGGGFTGIVEYYVLLDDGRLYQRGWRDSTYTQMNTWPRSFTRQMFSNYHALGLSEMKHYEPGDIYYFIQYRRGKSDIHRIAWGKPDFRTDEKLVQYYSVLFKSTTTGL